MEAASAGYGHTCANCVRAKCKCVIRDGEGCERCHRLGRECAPASFVRKRSAKSATPSAKRARLEDKLDDLVTLLRAQQTAQPSTSTHESFRTSQASPSPGNPSGEVPTVGDSISTLTFPLSVSPIAQSQDRELPFDEDDEYLKTFRLGYLQNFPFVYIEDNISAVEFAKKRPLLWATIQAACTKTMSKQTKLAVCIKEKLARLLIVEGEHSIDALLALLACMTCSYYFNKGKPLLTLYSNMARALINDLQISRCTPETLTATVNCQAPKAFPDSPTCSRACTKEDRRALLACFVFCTLSASSQRSDPMRWSPQMEESCKILTDDPDHFGDKVLVALARILRLAAETAEMIRHATEDVDYAKMTLLHIKPLKAAFEQLRSSLPSEVLAHNAVTSQLYAVQVLVHQLAMYEPQPWKFDPKMDAARVEHLTACLYAAKSCMDGLASQNVGITDLPTMFAFKHSLQVAYRLSLLEDPRWDRVGARAIVDVMFYLRNAVSLSEQANATLKAETGEDSMFLKAADTMRLLIPIWEAALDKAGAVDSTDAANWVGGEALDFSLMDFSDDLWMPAPDFLVLHG